MEWGTPGGGGGRAELHVGCNFRSQSHMGQVGLPATEGVGGGGLGIALLPRFPPPPSLCPPPPPSLSLSLLLLTKTSQPGDKFQQEVSMAPIHRIHGRKGFMTSHYAWSQLTN